MKRLAFISVKVIDPLREAVEMLVAKLTIERRKKHTLTDIVEESLYDFAKKHKVEINEGTTVGGPRSRQA